MKVFHSSSLLECSNSLAPQPMGFVDLEEGLGWYIGYIYHLHFSLHAQASYKCAHRLWSTDSEIGQWAILERFGPQTQRGCQSSTKELKTNRKQYRQINLHILTVLRCCSNSPQKYLTAAEHSNINVQRPNSWTKAEDLTAVICTQTKDLLYTIKVNLIIFLYFPMY